MEKKGRVAHRKTDTHKKKERNCVNLACGGKMIWAKVERSMAWWCESCGLKFFGSPRE
jgi:formamidopyrimidine-DNA glycosylase